jgi:hypothetical protein
MSKLEGMTKFKTTRNSSFVILVSSLFRHLPATPRLGEGGSFVIRHF